MNISFNKKLLLLLFGVLLNVTSAQASSIVVTSPIGGEYWGGVHTITWTSSSVPSGFVNIYRCTIPDCSATTTVQMNVPNTGSFLWDTTGLNEVSRIYIEDALSPGNFGISPNTFILDNSVSSCNATIASNNTTSPLFAKVGDLVMVNFDTCEAVTHTTAMVAGRSAYILNVGGTNYLATTTMQIGDKEGDIPFVIGYTDLAGNSLSRSTTANGSTVTFDITPPTLVISMASSALTSGSTTTVTFTFSEPVVGFTNASITKVDGGVISQVMSLDGGIVWTAVLTPSVLATSSLNSITVAMNSLTDRAGNSSSQIVSSPNYTVVPLPVVVVPPSPVVTPPTPPVRTCAKGSFLMTLPADTVKRKTKIDTTNKEHSKEKKNVSQEDNETYCFKKDLHTGDKDEEVKELQKRLVKEGLLKSEVTGYFGSLTKEALRSWQIKNNLEATGEVLGASVFTFQKDLYMGSQDNTVSEVKELQRRLIAEGLLNFEPTGYFGKITKKALIEWQIKNNLTAKGYLGPMSRELLNKNGERNG